MSQSIARERQSEGLPEQQGISGMLIFLLAMGGLFGLAMLLPMEYRVPVTLGIVQGLGEFLPISSSAHLIIVPEVFGWQDPGLTFSVALHMGTLLAVLGYFWRDWLRLLRAAPRPSTPDGRLFWYLMLATLPGGLVGFLLDELAERELRLLPLIAVTISLMGLLLWVADRYGRREKGLEQISLADALLVGLGQALAIIPGFSRSGSTMTIARLRGVSREAAARFSFLLGTPITVGAGLWKLKDLEPRQLSLPFFLGVAVAGVVGALSIGLLLRYLRREGFGIFVIYRLVLGALLLAFVLSR